MEHKKWDEARRLRILLKNQLRNSRNPPPTFRRFVESL